MGSLYRSEAMALCQLFIQSEASFNCLAQLGELGLVQFKDLNTHVNAFQRKFVSEVRRCEEMERKLRFLESEMTKSSITITDKDESPETPAPREMSDMEAMFDKLESDMKEVNSNLEVLKRNFLDLKELKHVLKHADTFFEETRGSDQFSMDSNSATENRNLGFVAGVILRDRLLSFERLLWRACRGNALIRSADIEDELQDPVTGETVVKSAFVVFFQGDNLKTRVKKICDGFRATVYQCPEKQAERLEMASGVLNRIEDLNTVLNQTEEHRRLTLLSASESIKVWIIKVKKLKAIFHTLNSFNIDITAKYLIGECWVPLSHWDRVEMALHTGAEKSGCDLTGAILSPMETKEQPPTYNRTNKFTKVFQGIVDSYGVATYMEVNPAPFCIVTFPFLFSLMFGDAGHGFLVLGAALWMVLFEKSLGKKKIDSEIWKIFFGGRYIILLMGLFSIYAGFIYNDFYSKSINIFGSAWYPNASRYSLELLENTKDITLDPTLNADYRGNPYPFGMDPAWQMSMNKITWLNSFKMKISIIFGISQMYTGVVLSLQNHRYFKDPINIFCEFIPEMIFLMCIFGYLIVLILYKWIAYNATMSNCAPSLLIDLINMFLMNYPTDPCGSATFYKSQQPFQTFLLLMAVLCIPWLLLPKPLILRSIHKRKMKSQGDKDQLLEHAEHANGENGSKSVVGERETAAAAKERQSTEATTETQIEIEVQASPPEAAAAAAAHGGGGHGHGAEFDFGEMFVHQCIHTIEYCLGCISHTASYLRLWALSLAHAELSEVLWNMVLHQGFTLLGPGYASCVIIFVIFTPWAVLTVAILLLMEGLSAFLHTLRLHWVEFQSKFYKGEGYPFEPFSFKRALRAEQ